MARRLLPAATHPRSAGLPAIPRARVGEADQPDSLSAKSEPSILAADHMLTTQQHRRLSAAAVIRNDVLGNLAAGIDTARAILCLQSHVPETGDSLMRRKVQEIQARLGVPCSPDVYILGAQPDLDRRVDNRLLEVPAHNGEVSAAEAHVQVQERFAVPE